jgi:hypothetical protein
MLTLIYNELLGNCDLPKPVDGRLILKWRLWAGVMWLGMGLIGGFL